MTTNLEKVKQCKECLERWEKAIPSLFEGIADKWERTTLAVVLDNQKLTMDSSGNYPPQLKEKVFEIINKVFRNLLPQKLISMQPMFGPNDDFYHFAFEQNNIKIEAEKCIAKTKKLAIDPITPETYKEDNWVDKLANQIRKAISKEIYSDIYNNAGIVETWNYDLSLTEKQRNDSLFDKIQEVGKKIHEKTLRGLPTWIVVNNVKIGDFLTNRRHDWVENVLNDRYVYFGALNNRYRLYADDTGFDDILIGYKGDSYMDSGYFYNPYVFLTPTPVQLDPEFRPRAGFLTRYSKKMLRNGPDFYARIKLENFPKE